MNPIENLWRETSDQLLSFITRRVNDRVLAEDIRQDVFLKMYDRLDGLRDAGKMQSWMYQIARNAIVDHYRSKKAMVDLPDDLSIDPGEDRDIRAEMASWLLLLIALLPETYREPVRLAEVEGLTHQQVADQLGISLSAAKSRVRRGKLMMKDWLTDCCQFEFDQRGRVVGYEGREDCCAES